MRGTFNITFDRQSLKKFEAACEAAIRNVSTGSKKATIEACEEIMRNSKEQVPRETQTLLMSAFYEVRQRGDAKGYKYEGIVGYGGNGNPVNPTSGLTAAEYMVAVHEDMVAVHPNGKAKFLEDPVREYGANNFKQTVFKNMQESLASMSD